MLHASTLPRACTRAMVALEAGARDTLTMLCAGRSRGTPHRDWSGRAERRRSGAGRRRRTPVRRAEGVGPPRGQPARGTGRGHGPRWRLRADRGRARRRRRRGARAGPARRRDHRRERGLEVGHGLVAAGRAGGRSAATDADAVVGAAGRHARASPPRRCAGSPRRAAGTRWSRRPTASGAGIRSCSAATTGPASPRWPPADIGARAYLTARAGVGADGAVRGHRRRHRHGRPRTAPPSRLTDHDCPGLGAGRRRSRGRDGGAAPDRGGIGGAPVHSGVSACRPSDEVVRCVTC